MASGKINIISGRVFRKGYAAHHARLSPLHDSAAPAARTRSEKRINASLDAMRREFSGRD